MVQKYFLSPRDQEELENLFLEIEEKFNSKIDVKVFLNESFLWATKLSESLKEKLYKFKVEEISNCLVIQGLPIDFCNVILTPENYKENTHSQLLSKDEIYLIIISSILGEVFTWDSIQNGNIINHIIPIKENENKPLSSGFINQFDLHTEDAFHPNSGEYLGLLCIRNPTKTPTTISWINKGDLSLQELKILFESRFIIGENLAHQVSEKNEFSPILFGSADSPYIKINLNKIKAIDTQAEKVLSKLTEVLRKNETKIVLEQGEVLFIDNLRTVHGRDPYTPSFNGFDRWLKRVYITDSLKNSRGLRDAPISRIIRIKSIK
jgi:hypothetical protein